MNAKQRIHSILFASLLLTFLAIPARADTLTFLIVYSAAAQGSAGNPGSIQMEVVSNTISPATQAVITNYSPTSGLGTVTNNIGGAGGLASTLTLTVASQIGNLYFGDYQQAINSFPGQTSMNVAVNYLSGTAAVFVVWFYGSAGTAFAGVFINTDGSQTDGIYTLLPGAVNYSTVSNISITQVPNATQAVPEPATLLLVGSGLAAGWLKRRKRL